MSIRTALAGLVLAALTLSPALAQDSFPLTVEHAMGEVSLDGAPSRIVVLSNRDADTLLALGIQPVGIRSIYDFAKGVGPWAEDLLTSEPTVWIGRELDYEAIASADPDLIVFANSGGVQEEYDRLSLIAPTLYLPKGAAGWGATTQETTLLIAKALGREADGHKLLAELDAYLAAQKAAHPEFAGKTGNYLDIYSGGISSYAESHIVNGALYAIGLEPVPGTDSIPSGQSSISVSAELVGDYVGDVTLIYPFGRTLDELIAETPTLGLVPQAETGGLMVLDNLAFSNASVLSIPYALDRLIPVFSTVLGQ
ncbi:MAG: ABC transporter substrate-binding protein [Devosia sp.]|uniref:ABC transporter substrate-binding protein n=1 Tax=Devosia sp. TaxID=1871048 RepID=UPI0024CD1267|nr:ABC transporter substrate-binding protein [Devosia sp.]UYN98147.1 MAG: ABC transporter substrate-binding protein [Devosia sp.]